MDVIRRIEDIRRILLKLKAEGKKIGFVPTMGYLHKGHMSLVERAKKDCDVVVLSIFVNPLQFGINEDYDIYPRDISRDTQLAESAQVDYIFYPGAKEMYPKGFSTFVNVENLTEVLCGARRPGHFKGVTTIVLKLLNIISPHRAYFGQKDAQQVTVIRRMVRDLNIPIEIMTVPIKRERDGLAISSRNEYLSKEERKQATCLYESLKMAEKMILQGERKSEKINKVMSKSILDHRLASVDYIEIVDSQTLKKIKTIKGKILIALAVKIGKTRLIDNLEMEI